MENIVLPTQVEQFLNAFRSIGAGSLSEDAAKKMARAIRATMVEGKKSTVTIKLHIKSNVEDQVVIEGECTASIPKPKLKAAFFVDTQTFMPTRNRPNQQILPGVNDAR